MDALVLEALLADQVGRNARIRKYDRSKANRTPINFMLDQAQRQLATPFDVYWVDDGLPELFCIHGANPDLVVYNTRYIELVYLIRRLMADRALDGVRVELAQRTCLRVMAELAVRYNGPQWAIRAFLKSVLDQTMVLVDIPGTALMDLEMQPIGEAYMSVWCFGLAHELGHLCSPALKAQVRQACGPEEARAGLERWLPGFPMLPGMAEEVWRLVDSGDPGYCLSLESLAEEAFADWFAGFQLYNTTQLIMHDVGSAFDVVRYVSEQCLCINIVSLLERCRQVASVAEAGIRDERERHQVLMRPLSYAVRRTMVRTLLDGMVASHLYAAERPTAAQRVHASGLVDEIEADLEPRLQQIEKGLAAAMRFALFPGERDGDLMRRYAQTGPTVVDSGAAYLCDLIESFHGRVESAEALRRVDAARRDRAA
jgi:hypothetical protein